MKVALLGTLASSAALLILPTLAARANLASDIRTILAAPQLRGGIDGVMIADARGGRTLFSANPDTLMITASNRKLFTGAAALALLGAGRAERTDVLAASPISPTGEIGGDLVLRGGGDPLLSAADLDRLAAQLTTSGLRHVAGGVVGDKELFSGSPWGDGWQVDSLLDYYSPEISALEVNEGIATVALHGGAKAGDPTTYDADPKTSYFTVEDRATTGASGSAVVIDRDRALCSTHVLVGGSIPAGRSPDPTDDSTDGRITLPSPALYAATIFTEKLRAHGIAVDSPPRLGAAAPGMAVLISHESIPLAQMLGAMLKPSDNLIAETLTRLEAAQPGRAATFDDGVAAEMKYFATIGITPDMVSFADGSGESRLTMATPRAILILLEAMTRRSDFRLFYDSMSIVGIDGTAAGRMRGTRAEGNAHVKTGTVRRCRALSGYVTGRNGRLYAFVILMNNHLLPPRAMGAIQDKIVERLAEER